MHLTMKINKFYISMNKKKKQFSTNRSVEQNPSRGSESENGNLRVPEMPVFVAGRDAASSPLLSLAFW